MRGKQVGSGFEARRQRTDGMGIDLDVVVQKKNETVDGGANAKIDRGAEALIRILPNGAQRHGGRARGAIGDPRVRAVASTVIHDDDLARTASSTVDLGGVDDRWQELLEQVQAVPRRDDDGDGERHFNS